MERLKTSSLRNGKRLKYLNMARGSQQRTLALGQTSLACHQHSSFGIPTPWCRDLIYHTHHVADLLTPLSLHAHDVVLDEPRVLGSPTTLHQTFVPSLLLSCSLDLVQMGIQLSPDLSQ